MLNRLVQAHHRVQHPREQGEAADARPPATDIVITRAARLPILQGGL